MTKHLGKTGTVWTKQRVSDRNTETSRSQINRLHSKLIFVNKR